MNKLFTKIAGISLGLAMALGVGVAVTKNAFQSNSNPAFASENDTHDFSQSISQLLNNNASIPGINIAQQSYSVKQIIITYSWNNAASYSGLVSASATVGSTSFGSGVTTTKNATITLSGASTVGAVSISFTNNTGSGTGHGTFNVTNVRLIEGTPVTNDYITDFSVAPSTALTVKEDSEIDVSGITVSGSKNGGAVGALSAADYVFQGSGKGTGSEFVSSSTTNYKLGDTRLQWKAKYPTTSGGSTYAYAGISLTVQAEQVEYIKVTDDADLKAGNKYLLVSEFAVSEKYYAMAGVSSSIGQIAQITLDTANHRIASKVDKGSAVEYTLGGESGAWTLKGNNVFLSYSGSSNNISTSETASTNNQKWTIATSTGTITNKAVTDRKLQFNSDRFCCYSSSQKPVYLYEKVLLEPALSMDETLEGFVGEEGKTLTVTPANYYPDTFVWTSSDESVAEVSGNTATASLTLKAAGTTNIKVVASKDAVSVEKTCVLTVKPAPTAVQIKVSSQVIDNEYVMEQWEGGHKDPTISVLPAEANQNVVLTVQSETVSGAFTITNKSIYFVKPATGVIRVASFAKPSVYFDLNVKCNEDPFTADTLSFSGEPVAQSYGTAFDATGLTFSITKASGNKTVAKSELTFEPATMDYDTTVVTATHAASGQSVDIPVTVTQPLTVAEALAIIDALADGAETSQKYTVRGIVSWAQDLSGTSYTTQDYRISDNGADTEGTTLTIYRGKWVDGDNMSYNDGIYAGEGDKVIVNGKLKKYVSGNNTTPEMIGNAPMIKTTIYYLQIKGWIDTNLYLNTYTTNNGYCNDQEHHYYLTAKVALKTLNDSYPGAISEFESNQEADFKAAYARYVAWADANGDATPFDGTDTISSSRINIFGINSDGNKVAIILVITSVLSLTAVGAYFFFKKKHQ